MKYHCMIILETHGYNIWPVHCEGMSHFAVFHKCDQASWWKPCKPAKWPLVAKTETAQTLCCIFFPSGIERGRIQVRYKISYYLDKLMNFPKLRNSRTKTNRKILRLDTSTRLFSVFYLSPCTRVLLVDLVDTSTRLLIRVHFSLAWSLI